ncbi:unnamed protein product [Effrenium voratum]|nr:unnamed protein product [Effrenium voratum]
MLCLIITPLAFLILLLIAIFNVCLARLLTAPGAVLFNLGAPGPKLTPRVWLGNAFMRRFMRRLGRAGADLTIPDLAALRSSVAQQVLDQVPPGDRLAYEGVERMAEAWCFFEVLVGVCDGDSCDGHQCACHPRAEKRGGGSARQPVVGKPADEEAVEEDVRLVALSRVASSQVNAQWLQEHGDFVRAAMAPHIDLLRQALDSLGSRFNSSGLTLDDAVGGRTQEETAEALRCFLCNLQAPEPRRNRRGSVASCGAAAAVRLGRLAAQLTPQRLADYHRQMARFGVAKARRDFRQYMTVLQRNLEASVAQNECPLSGAVLQHLREVESFLTTIYRFFKCVDMGGGEERTEGGDVRQSVSSPPEAASDDSEEGPKTAPKPSLDRGVAGYVACLNCGHNGVLSEGEAQHLALHLRSARFGKYAGEELEGGRV